MADRFARRLAAEVETWVRDGLVSAEQAARIVARYPPSAAWYARPAALFALVGGALVAAGIALVVAHNWAEIHRWVKLAGLIALMLGSHGGGLALRERDRRALGDGILLLGGALLLVGIALVGQIYHLSGRTSDTVLLWWALLLPAGYALPSGAVLGLGYAGVEGWFLLALADPTTWLGAAANYRFMTEVVLAGFGLVLFPLGIAHGRGEYRAVGRFIELLGLAGVMAGLFGLGASWQSGAYGRYALGGLRSMSPAFVLLGIAAVLIVVSMVRLPAGRARRGFTALLLVVAAVLGAFAAAGARAPSTDVDVTLRLGPLSWAVQFMLALGLIIAGARVGRASWINIGLVTILVQAVWRYVDLVGGMLGTAALFLSTGVVVMLLGWCLERVRRRMTRDAGVRPVER